MFAETRVAVFSSSTGRSIIFPEDHERHRGEYRGHDYVSTSSRTACWSVSDLMAPSLNATHVTGSELENWQTKKQLDRQRQQQQTSQDPSRKVKGFVLNRANVKVWSSPKDEGVCCCRSCRVVDKNKHHGRGHNFIYENVFSWRRRGHQ